MKILFVDQTGQLGGGELSILEVIKNSSHDAEVALFADGPFLQALEELHVPVHLLSLGKVGEIRREAGVASLLSGLPAILRLRQDLARLAAGFDVIYANSQKAFLMSALARKGGQPLIWHLRDMLTADHFSPSMRRAAVLAGNRAATAVIVNSEATRESFVVAGGKREKTAVVYNGIDPGPFDAVSDHDVQQLREAWGVQHKFVAGVFGRLTSWKGQHIVIDALSALPDAHLLIVGDALFGEHAYAEELRARARSQGIENRVHFLGFRQDIPTLMKLCDVVIHSSIASEPFGRVIVEAMLAGRPVIASRAGGVIEIVENGVSGILVAPGSKEELAEAMIRLRDNEEFSEALRLAGKIRASQLFSVHGMMNGIDRVLNTCLTRNWD